MAALAKIYLELLLQDPLSWVFLASLAFMLLQLWRQSKSPSPPLPPGPKPLPIIGNMLMMHQLTHRGLAALADKHGGLVHLRLGQVHAFALSTPEYAREVLQAQDMAFANRPATMAVAYLTYGRADMAFAHYGPFWRKARKLSATKLFSRRRAETWLAVRDECAALVRAVARSAGEAVNVGELIFDLTKNAIYRAAFGTRDGERQAEFIAILQEFSQLLGAFNVGDFIPWLGWMDPHGINRRLRVARAALDRFIDKIIDEHIKRGKSPSDAGSDMVDEMLAYLAELNTTDGAAGWDDQENTLRLTRNNIKGIIMDMMFGGTETVASGIEWAMVEMVRSPDDLRRLQQELADVVGLDRNVDETDLGNLPFLKCVVKETLRPGEAIKSRPFLVGGRKWYVNYQPNGNTAEDIDFISPSLYLDDTVTEAVKASSKFSLLDQDGKPVPSYSFTTKVVNFSDEKNWGYPKFIKREVLEKSEYLKDDSFTVRFDVTVMKDVHTQDIPVIMVPPSDMHRHFGELLSSKEGADVKFRVRKKTFSAHRSVLAARSPVFKKALLGPMKEGTTTSVIPIDDMEAGVFEALLTFMYTGDLPDTIKEQEESAMAQHLLVAADKYNLERLKLICEDKLCKHLDTGSVATILALAEQHNCHVLKDACLDFLSTSTALKEVMETDGFEYLTKNFPSVMKELLSKGASVD